MEKNTKTVFSQEPTKLKLRLSTLCESKIRTACSVFPDREWSGAAFYRYTNDKGSTNMEDTKIEIVDFCLQDIGNATYTEYNLDGNTAAYYADHLDTLAGTKIGLLHSHNQMKAYLSGTDMSTLKEQAEQCNNVLSIVVNNAGNYVAKFTEKRRVIQSDSITIDTTKDIMMNYMGDRTHSTKENYTTHMNNQEDYYEVLCWDCDIERPLDVPVDEEFKKECLEKQELFKHKKEENVWKRDRDFPDFGGYGYRDLWNKGKHEVDAYKITLMFQSIYFLSFGTSYSVHAYGALDDSLPETFIDYFLCAWMDYYDPTSEQIAGVIDKFKHIPEDCGFPNTRKLIIEYLTEELIIENGDE